MNKKKQTKKKNYWEYIYIIFPFIISGFAGLGYLLYASRMNNGVYWSVFLSCCFSAAVMFYIGGKYKK